MKEAEDADRRLRRAASLAATLAIGAGGAWIAQALGLPAPFLMGPAVVVPLAGIAGLDTRLPDLLRNGVFVVIGIGMGQGLTPDILSDAMNWPVSLVIMLLNVTAILLGGAALLQVVFGHDRTSALLAASPGHLSFVLSLSADTGADLPRIVLIQTLRVLSLMLIVPPILAGGQDLNLDRLTNPEQVLRAAALAWLVVLSFGAGWGLSRLRLPAAFLLAGAGISALGHASGLSPGSLPGWLGLPAFVLVGTLIGSRFAGFDRRLLGAVVLATLCLAALSAVLSVLAAWLVSQLLPIPFLQALIAMAPGGVDAMIALSVLMDVDGAYVATHHVLRILALTILVPSVLPRRKVGAARHDLPPV